MYYYKAKLSRVIDGDTIVFDIDLGFGIWMKNEHVRLARINCPEIRTRDLNEKRKGIEATNFVKEIILNYEHDKNCEIRLRTYKNSGKYGRYIADVLLYKNDEVQVLNELVVEAGHAIYVDY